MINKLLFTFVLSLLYVQSFSQNNNNNKSPIIKTHYYTFSGIASQQELDNFEMTLKRIEFVTEAKIKYKPEKNMGQIIFTTKEFEMVSEKDRSFSPTSVKQAIIKQGLTPKEYNVPNLN